MHLSHFRFTNKREDGKNHNEQSQIAPNIFTSKNNSVFNNFNDFSTTTETKQILSPSHKRINGFDSEIFKNSLYIEEDEIKQEPTYKQLSNDQNITNNKYLFSSNSNTKKDIFASITYWLNFALVELRRAFNTLFGEATKVQNTIPILHKRQELIENVEKISSINKKIERLTKPNSIPAGEKEERFSEIETYLTQAYEINTQLNKNLPKETTKNPTKSVFSKLKERLNNPELSDYQF